MDSDRNNETGHTSYVERHTQNTSLILRVEP